jgi:hypothetical protein
VVNVRRWWAVPVLLGVSLVVQKVFFETRYDVSGHAAEHLTGASAPFAAFAVVAVLLYATPRARRQPLVLIMSVAWLVCTVLILVGNVRVVDALVRAGMARTPTSQLSYDATVDAAHGLANLAPWLAVGAAVILAVAFWRYRHVSGRVAFGAAALSVVFPPWIIPGAGVLVLTVARCIAYHRSFAADRPSPTGASAPALP